jgi:hypothetical protein
VNDINTIRTNKVLDRTTGLKSEQQLNTIKSSHIAVDGKQQLNNSLQLVLFEHYAWVVALQLGYSPEHVVFPVSFVQSVKSTTGHCSVETVDLN